MRETYWDESETKIFGDTVLFFAAYLAQEEQWQSFNAEWNEEIVKRFSIPYLHAVDLRSKKRSLYKHLDLAARKELLSTATQLIISHVEAGFVTYIRPDDLIALATPVERAQWGGAYAICAQLMLSLISWHLKSPERVNVFLEAGHAGATAALQKIKDYKGDTEPIEWPAIVKDGDYHDDDSPETQMRKSAMRIEQYGTVLKKDCAPTQAADLLAYLASTAVMNDTHPLLSGCLDVLIQGKPHALSPWGPKALKELVEACRLGNERRKADRNNIYRIRDFLHSRGIRSHLLPWGIVLDKESPDDLTETLEHQLQDIRKKVL